MCQYQRIKGENQMPICEHTKSWCTYCVLGNRNTYKEAEEAEKAEKAKKGGE